MKNNIDKTVEEILNCSYVREFFFDTERDYLRRLIRISINKGLEMKLEVIKCRKK